MSKHHISFKQHNRGGLTPHSRSVGLRVAAAAVVALTTLATASHVQARSGLSAADDPGQRKKEVDEKITEVSQELAGTSAELKKAYGLLNASISQLPGAKAALEKAEEVRGAAQRHDAEMTRQLKAAEAAAALKATQVRKTQNKIDDTESLVGRVAARAYREGAFTDDLTAALTGDNFQDSAQRLIAANTAMRLQKSSLDRLQQQQAVMATMKERLDAVEEEVEQLRQQAAKALAAARAAEKDATAKKEAVEQLVADRQAATETIKARKAEEEAELAKLKQESDALAAEMRRIAEEERRRAEAERRRREAAERARAEARKAKKGTRPKTSPRTAPKTAPKGRVPVPSGKGRLMRPVAGPITSPYGWRIHPIYKTRRMHTGTDFGGGCGKPIRAAENGRIVRTGWAGGYGKQILMSNGLIGGKVITTSYNHLSSFAVSNGAMVRRGQVIGYVGTTGASTGCHLHFEVFVNGGRINPMRYL